MKQLWKALGQAQAEYPPIPKSKKAQVGTYSYKYADLADIIPAVTPVNVKYGLVVTQIPFTEDGQHKLLTTLAHESGESIDGVMDLEPKDRSPQALGSAITYARRYAMSAMLGIVTEDDDDGKIASEVAERKQPTEVQRLNKARSVLTALMREGGLNRQDGLDFCSMVVDREVDDKNDLSLEEITKVIERLKANQVDKKKEEAEG